MLDNTLSSNENGKSNDSGYTSPPSPSHITGIEIEECKTEPYSDVTSTNENHQSVFDDSSTLHIPICMPKAKTPVILLEKCDKIWETLKLIKTVQSKNSATKCDNEEKAELLTDDKQITSDVKNSPATKNDNTSFQFSVQRMKKVFPCSTCGKHYMENRSLRKHSEREHGIIIPLIRPRTLKLIKKEDKNSEKLDNDTSASKNVTTLSVETTEMPRTSFKRKIKNTYFETDLNIKTKRIDVTSLPTARKLVSSALKQCIKCTLCQQNVKSIKRHLISYHKIGTSSYLMKQLESSLLVENKTPSGEKRTMLKNILSGKPSHISGHKNVQNRSNIMSIEDKIQTMFQFSKKEKPTLPYIGIRKQSKINNKRASIQSIQSHTPKYDSLNTLLYKCEICLGIYSSANSFYKHRRIHRLRGETKENFHTFKCRYHNSPLNKKYQLPESSTELTNANTNISNSTNKKLPLNNSQKTLFVESHEIPQMARATKYDEKTKRCNKTTCICGKVFRNPNTLFIHKNSCKLYSLKNVIVQRNVRCSNNKDSGIGLNITIKKRNDSYEIVGKDDEEDKIKTVEHSENDTIHSNISTHTIKNLTNTSSKHQPNNIFVTSKYSKDHSILKLRNADEDMIIDIEDDEQHDNIINEKANQIVLQTDNEKNLHEQRNNKVENMEDKVSLYKVRTLKQICQDVLNVHAKACMSESTPVCKTEQELCSASKGHQNIRREHDYSHYQESSMEKTCIKKLDLLSRCGYCNKQFNSNYSSDNHQCNVREGKHFNESALLLVCLYCHDVLDNYNDFDKHMRNKHLKDNYHCYYCVDTFLHIRERQHHFRTKHSDVVCRFCNKKLNSKVKVLHEGYHLGFGFPCHKCKKSYSNKRKLSYHNRSSHSGGTENTVTCTVCLKPVKIKALSHHMILHKHNECHFCGKVFTNKTGVEYHTMVYHKGVHSKLKCNNCGIRFLSKKQFEKHQQTNACKNDMNIAKKKTKTIDIKSN